MARQWTVVFNDDSDDPADVLNHIYRYEVLGFKAEIIHSPES